MPTDQRTLDIEVPLLRAIPPVAGESTDCFPYLPLEPTGESTVKTLQFVELRNDFLSVLVAVDLGGRILEIRDLVNNQAVLELPKAIEIQPQGRRGASCPQGIEWWVGEEVRPTSLAPIDYQIRSEESGETLLMHDLVAGAGLSVHASIHLPHNAARVELTVQVFNRTLAPVACDQGVRCAWGSAPVAIGAESVVLFDSDRQVVLAFHQDPGLFENTTWRDGVVSLGYAPAGSDYHLPPHQTLGWTTSITVGTGLPSLEAHSPGGFLSVTQSAMAFCPNGQHEDAKFFLLGATGELLEAETDIQPLRVFRADLIGPAAYPSKIGLRDHEDQWILSWDRAESPEVRAAPRLVSTKPTERARRIEAMGKTLPLLDQQVLEVELQWARKERDLIGATYYIAALDACRQQQWAVAMEHLSQAIEANSADTLAWWLRAVIRRQDPHQDPEENADDLVNAHYFGPMDPVLRAEAFLSQSMEMGKEPTDFLKSLVADPEAVADVACQLLSAGLYDQAARWIDECLRHAEFPNLRYLIAWMHMKITSLEFEAQAHLRAVVELPIEAPLPWRPLERRAVAKLYEFFPEDPRLRELHGILAANP